jgi:hypothetical protein
MSRLNYTPSMFNPRDMARIVLRNLGWWNVDAFIAGSTAVEILHAVDSATRDAGRDLRVTYEKKT